MASTYNSERWFFHRVSFVVEIFGLYNIAWFSRGKSVFELFHIRVFPVSWGKIEKRLHMSISLLQVSIEVKSFFEIMSCVEYCCLGVGVFWISLLGLVLSSKCIIRVYYQETCKMVDKFEIVRLGQNEAAERTTFDELFSEEKAGFMFVSPHDDDVILGGGLTMQIAIEKGVDVHVLVITDGSMGYCSLDEKDSISEIRKAETYSCYEALGIKHENIHWLAFPDSGLNQYRGRRAAREGDRVVIGGFTGMQNAFTHYLREIRPSHCFVPTFTDLHPDHKIVYEELLISLFHATGDIWPELGVKLENLPVVYELGVYCDFPARPDVLIRADEKYLEGKVIGIEKFVSQKQISALIDIVRQSGPVELLRNTRFRYYDPANYLELFKL